MLNNRYEVIEMNKEEKSILSVKELLCFVCPNHVSFFLEAFDEEMKSLSPSFNTGVTQVETFDKSLFLLINITIANSIIVTSTKDSDTNR